MIIFLDVLMLVLLCSLTIGLFLIWNHAVFNKKQLGDRIEKSEEIIRKLLEEMSTRSNQSSALHQKLLSDHLLQGFDLLQKSLQNHLLGSREENRNILLQNSKELSSRVEKLTQETAQHLKEISGQVEKRLSDGFEKTTATFADVVKRLALIDEAQKRITELSSNVISLQEILSDKRSRGAFGEVQLSALIRNVLPENTFSLQHTLTNGKRVDCFLFMPKPTGNIAIDAKFPLESYRILTDIKLSDIERQTAEQQFKVDIRKHIQDISEKYIIPGETSDGAVMFIPAEAVFAEIHAHHPDIIELAQKSRVWMTSPTTMMAILTTLRAVLKDEATKEQVHLIKEHLSALAKDFGRFQNRFDDLATHITQAQKDVEQVHVSAKKITSRFNKIEKVEFDGKTETIEMLESHEDN